MNNKHKEIIAVLHSTVTTPEYFMRSIRKETFIPVYTIPTKQS